MNTINGSDEPNPNRLGLTEDYHLDDLAGQNYVNSADLAQSADQHGTRINANHATNHATANRSNSSQTAALHGTRVDSNHVTANRSDDVGRHPNKIILGTEQLARDRMGNDQIRKSDMQKAAYAREARSDREMLSDDDSSGQWTGGRYNSARLANIANLAAARQADRDMAERDKMDATPAAHWYDGDVESTPRRDSLRAVPWFNNESGLDFIDISSEKERTYNFGSKGFVRIVAPIKLHVSDSHSHRIFTADGRSHYIPTGWIQLTWVARSGQPNFVK